MTKEQELNEIGEYVNTRSQEEKFVDVPTITGAMARKIALEKYPKKVLDRYSNKELRIAWFSFEPQ